MAVVLQDFDHRINHLTGDKTVNDIENEIAKQTSDAEKLGFSSTS